MEGSSQNSNVTLAITLTAREQVIICAIADEMQTKMIAPMLGVSYSAAAKAVAALFLKCGVSSRMGLVLFGVRRGVVRP